MHNCPVPNLIYAIDIGGTKIDCIRLLNEELSYYQMNTPNSGDYQTDIKLLCEWISNFLIPGNGKVVISFPGLVKDGVILKWPNKVYWESNRFSEDVSKIFTNYCVEIYEDCNMGAFVNKLLFVDNSHSIYINVGTGIGCGILIDGKLFTGIHGYAGEFGHTIVSTNSNIQCTCGKSGCLQLFSSGRGMLQRIKEKSKKYNMVSSIEELSEDLDSSNDDVVKDTLKEGARLFGIALSNLISILDISEIHFGGSVLHNKFFLKTFIETIHKLEREFLQRDLKLIINPFFNSSLIGAFMKAVDYEDLSVANRGRIKKALKQYRTVK